MTTRSSLLHFVFFHPQSFLRQVICVVLAWATVMSTLPTYAEDRHPAPHWVDHWDFELLPPAFLSNAAADAVTSEQPASRVRTIAVQKKSTLVTTPFRNAAASGLNAPQSFEMAALLGSPVHDLLKPPFMMQPGGPTGVAALAVFVGYADDVRASPSFPVPWQGSPNTTFIGNGPSFDAGGIRLDNNSDSPIVINDVFVTVPGWTTSDRFDSHGNGIADLWGSFTIAPHSTVILTQTGEFNFDTSDFGLRGCGDTIPDGQAPFPAVQITINGVPTTFNDTGHVLDTGGFDLACRGNESLQWRLIGTAGIQNTTGHLTLNPPTSVQPAGTPYTATAQLTDAGGQPTPNATVTFMVLSGPNAGKQGTGTTDFQGNATFTYTSAVAGTDILQATVTNTTGGSIQSDQVTTTWTSSDPCPAPKQPPDPATTTIALVGQSTGEFSDPLTLAAQLTDGNGVPLSGRSLSFVFSGQTSAATTDGSGIASLNIPAAPAPGAVPLAVSFAGETNFKAAQLNTSISIGREETSLRYTGGTLLGTAVPQTVSAVLTDPQGGAPIANELITFRVGTVQAQATTNAQGVATTTLTLGPDQTTGPTAIQVSFAGDSLYKPSVTGIPVTVYLSTSFVVWGGNTGGLKLGQDVNFWGAQWAAQVTGGNFTGNPSFKGFADPVNQVHVCEVSAGAGGPLDDACWRSKPGQSFPPPLTLPAFIEVIVSTAITKQGSEIFGNIAAAAVCQVDPTPAYAPDPGHPGFCKLVAVVEDGAGIFPQPPSLIATQTQPATVLPAQNFNVTTTVTNNSTAQANSVVVSESFDGVTPATGTQTFNSILNGQQQTATFQVTTPAIPIRQSSETSAAYQARLAGLDGRLFTSTGTVSFTDAFGQPFLPIGVSSFSRLQIPELTVGISGPSCVGPGSKIPYKVTVNNIGTADAKNVSILMVFPDGTTATATIAAIPVGGSVSTTINFVVPAITGKQPNETDQQYLARLAAIDGSSLVATARVDWQDAIGNNYGEIEQKIVSTTERVPIITVTPTGPTTLLPGQKATLNFAVQNIGGGNASQVQLQITNPDGSVTNIPAFALQGGQATSVSSTFTVPVAQARQPGETDAAYQSRLAGIDNSALNFPGKLSWLDAAANSYGPTSSSFSSKEILPVLTVELTGPANTTSGENSNYHLKVTNIGHADAASFTAPVQLPDGRVVNPFPASGLTVGSVAQIFVPFTVPKTQPDGQISATATLNWSDANTNAYGPQSSTVVSNNTKPNQPPVVNAGPNQTITLPTNFVVLNGTVTDDGKPKGATLTIQWSVVSGPAAVTFSIPNQPVTQAVFAAAGVYVLQLSANDTQFTTTSNVTVTVNANGNQPPLVNAGPDQTIPLPAVATFNGSVTDDGLPPGAPLTSAWKLLSGPGVVLFSSPNSPHTFATASAIGNYVLQLSGNDTQFTTTSNVNLTVNPPVIPNNNLPPVVNAGPNQTITLPTNSVTLNGTVTDNDGLPVGGTLTQFWAAVSSPGTVTFANGQSAVTTATFSSAGIYVLRLTASDSELTGSADVTITVLGTNANPTTTLTLSPAVAGPLVTGTSQTLTATLLNNNSPVSGISVTFAVTGTNTLTGTAVTNTNGIASFTYSGAKAGTDTVQASALFSGNQIQSATSSVSWVTPTQQISTTTVNGRFFTSDGSGSFDIPPTQPPAFTQNFPTINFNPPSGTIPGDTSGVGVNTRPFTNVTTDLNGNFTGTIVAQGNGLQAGVGSLFTFQAVFTGTYTVASAGDVTFNFFSDDGFVFGIANGATRVSGAFANPPASGLTAFQSYPVMGAFNFPTAPVANSVTVHFPAAGTYPYELDFTECCGGQIALTMAGTNSHGIPPSGSLTLTPNSVPTTNTGQTRSFTVLAQDASGAALPGVTVNLAIGGANVQQPLQAVTDATGHASFSYVGVNGGTDTLQAQAQLTGMVAYSNQVSFQWNFVANQPPVVSAGSNQTITLPTTTVTLNGSASGGVGPLTLTWSEVSGPSTATFTSPHSAVTQATLTTAGTYTFQLSATDGTNTTNATTQVVVKPNPAPVVNQPPVVSAGADQTIQLPTNSVTLNGTATDDGLPSGSTLTVSWTQISGPAGVVFSAPNQSVTQVTFTAAGTYDLRLIASDSQLFSSSDVHVIVKPALQALTVSAGPGQTITLPVNKVTMNGSASGGNGPLTITWSTVSGPASVIFSAPNAAVTQATFGAAGTYVLQLSATDGTTTVASTATVVVNAGPPPPITVSAGPSQTITLPTNSVTLNGSAIGGKPPLTITWSEVSGPATVTFSSPNSAVTQATFTTFGIYVLQLTATDGTSTASITTSVTVNPVPIVVSAGANQTITLPTNSVTLNGSASGGSGPLTLTWSEFSGPAPVTFGSPSSAVTQATFSVAGTYILQLSATDGINTVSAKTIVSVNPPPAQPPVVSAGPNQTITLPTNTVTLNGSATSSNGPITFAWSEVSGPAAVTFSSPNSAVTQATFSVAGTYVLQLSANDTKFIVTATTSVIVNPPPPPPPPPTVNTTLPEGTQVSGPLQIIGSVSNGSWSLAYALNSADGVGPAPTFVTFASGTNAVNNGLLGTFDPTSLLNGTYTIRLTSTDQFGQTSTFSSNVTVSGTAKVGNFSISFIDLDVPVSGLPIRITRSYDSRDKTVRDFGVGWMLSLANVRLQKNGKLGANWQVVETGGFLPSFCLQPTSPHIITITFPDNRVYKFQESTDPQCSLLFPIESANLTFTQVPGLANTQGASLQIVGDNSVLVSSPAPGPTDLLDFTTIEDANPTVFQLSTAEGFTYVIDQTFGVTQMSDPNGNRITINASGITSSTGKNIAFTRDAQGRITQITDLVGNTLKYTYSAAGDLSTFTDRSGNTSTFDYDGGHFLLDIIDARGVHALTNTFDASGRLVATTDANGNTINYTNDVAASHETVTDRLGNATSYDYDNQGNIIKITDPLGNITTRTFDSNGNKLSETNALGQITTFTYDALGNRLSLTDPLGHTTTSDYNPLKQLTSFTDALGHVTTNSFDSQGNLLSTKDPAGNTISLAPDSQGLPSTVTDALGNKYSFTHDSAGRLTQQTDALGNTTGFAYDANGNKLSQTVKRTRSDGTTETLTTQYQYDPNGHLIKTISPDGSIIQASFNAIGKQSDAVDALGRKTHYDYDGNGRLFRTTFADGTSESVTYDAEDHVLSKTDRAGRTTSFVYDPLGRVTKTTYPDGTNTQIVYDAVGQKIKSIDQRGNVTQYTYDAAGRQTSTIDPLGHVTKFAYDAAGNLVSGTDALGHTTQMVYDASNRRTQTIFPDGTSTSTTYDPFGRTTSRTDQAGKKTQFAYDKLGRLVSVTDALNHVTTFAYDQVGNLISQTDANGHTTSFAYDQLGHRIRRTLPLGQVESSAYDATGNLVSRTDFNGKTTTYTYDSANRLLQKTPDSSLHAPPVTFTYTATGLRTTMMDASGTTSYTYDQLDRLTSKTTTVGTLSYTYDSAGNILSIKSSNAGGASMTYTYDALNRLATVTDVSGSMSYGYDAVGNLNGVTYPSGISTSYSYNTLNRLVQMQSTCSIPSSSCSAPGASIASYAYTLGPAGNRLSVSELSGRTVQYAYDDLYRLTSESIAGASAQNGAISYQYDKVGNRLQLSSTVPAIPSGLLNYDANDRLATDGYDSNGNVINEAGIANSYDFENHLLQRGGIAIVYDGDGNRVSKTVAGITTSYLIDANNPTGFVQVAEELQNGVVARAYTYGLELLDERQKVGGTPTTSFYGYDGHGSVRFLTNNSGAITDTYDYDAFGNLIASSGSTPNNYLFAGQQFDPDLGLYYLRARYLDTRTGRFWSQDPASGSPFDPESLHRYLYAHDDPVSRIDPSGEQDLVDVVMTSAIIGTLAGATLGLIACGWGCAARGAAFGFLGGILIPLLSAVVVMGLVWLGVGAATAAFISLSVFTLIGTILGIRAYQQATTTRQKIAAVLGIVLALVFFAVGVNSLGGDNPPPPPNLDEVPPNPNILSGHGEWHPADGYTTVPEGTTVTLPTGIKVFPEGTISDPYGNALETGGDLAPFVDEMDGALTYLPGSQIPNLELSPPTGLNIQGNPTTVTTPTPLSQLIQPNMGNVIWAACCTVSPAEVPPGGLPPTVP